MKVNYADAGIERLCTDEGWLRRKRGDLAKKLPLRVKALEAAAVVAELHSSDPLGKWHELAADRSGHWAGKVSDNYRLVVRPGGAAEAREADRVTVTEIIDYH